ncbi:MerR family transcriptional regulator [Cohnella rhizosphaerae]|uniref:MerR family transcriptional regulator n=1 Tax=Cohnella rhizosphaerae TaxID=1457232 RepID=A0A9X4L357_9BACL|nr:MerR family transcriptional regulator [Cohnella rhizosphaerae]MDG0812799.1 MerR family transcriptional regulator [Cohnella rhizosphaerae]
MAYSVKEVSKMFNLPQHTFRYYEKEGLLPAIERLDNGRRIYRESDLARIRMIICMREAGMSVDSIKAFNRLDLLGEDTLPDKRRIIQEQKTQVEDKIQELQELLELLNMKLDHYDERIAKRG